MNTSSNAQHYTQFDANKFVGQHVKTTSGEHGTVHHAEPSIDGTRIVLYVTVANWSILTDNEHATIQRHGTDSAHHYKFAEGHYSVEED